MKSGRVGFRTFEFDQFVGALAMLRVAYNLQNLELQLVAHPPLMPTDQGRGISHYASWGNVLHAVPCTS